MHRPVLHDQGHETKSYGRIEKPLLIIDEDRPGRPTVGSRDAEEVAGLLRRLGPGEAVHRLQYAVLGQEPNAFLDVLAAGDNLNDVSSFHHPLQHIANLLKVVCLALQW